MSRRADGRSRHPGGPGPDGTGAPPRRPEGRTAASRTDTAAHADPADAPTMRRPPQRRGPSPDDVPEAARGEGLRTARPNRPEGIADAMAPASALRRTRPRGARLESVRSGKTGRARCAGAAPWTVGGCAACGRACLQPPRDRSAADCRPARWPATTAGPLSPRSGPRGARTGLGRSRAPVARMGVPAPAETSGPKAAVRCWPGRLRRVPAMLSRCPKAPGRSDRPGGRPPPPSGDPAAMATVVPLARQTG